MQARQHLKALSALIPKERLYLPDDDRFSKAQFQAYGQDRSVRSARSADRAPAPPALLIFPANSNELVEVIRYAGKSGLKLVPSGGRSGLSGGALAGRGEAVLSLQKMDRLLGFDPLMPALHVEAGMVTDQLQRLAAERGLYFPLELASSGSSQIGGNIATNAGGHRVLRYGRLRDWIAGLTVVTGKGELLRFPGRVRKDNAGFDLKQLFIGQEGLLGVISEAVVRLAPLPKESGLLLIGAPHLRPLLSLLTSLLSAGLVPLAYEFWDQAAQEAVCREQQLPAPFPEPWPCYALLEWQLNEMNLEELMQQIKKIERKPDRIADGSPIGATALANSSEHRRLFWSYRERISESLSSSPLLHKQDLSMPLALMARFTDWARALIARRFPALKPLFFGHIGDGSLHLNLRGEPGLKPEQFLRLCRRLDHQIFSLISRFNGSISAEHGLGLLKREQIGYVRSPEEIEIMRQLKHILDPIGLLNPGKLLPPTAGSRKPLKQRPLKQRPLEQRPLKQRPIELL